MYLSSTVVESQLRQLVTYITRRFVVSRNTCRLVDHTRGTHAKKINKGRRRNSYIYIDTIYTFPERYIRAIHSSKYRRRCAFTQASRFCHVTLELTTFDICATMLCLFCYVPLSHQLLRPLNRRRVDRRRGE